MTDTYKTSYVVPRKTSVTVGEDEIDVAAYINTCDSCDSCPDSANGTSSDGVWKDGETSISFYPHLNYSTEKYGMVDGVRSQNCQKHPKKRCCFLRYLFMFSMFPY